MMLRLIPQKESRWLDLPMGVRVKVRPLTTAVVSAAKNEAFKRAAVLRVEADEQAATGFGADPTAPGWANADWRAGAIEEFYAEALMRFAVEEWEGVGDEAGEPLPITPASLRALASCEPIARAFLDEAMRLLNAVSAEGNGFAPTSRGDGAGAATTAPDAATTAAQPVH
jgi:hypothetical protein